MTSPSNSFRETLELAVSTREGSVAARCRGQEELHKGVLGFVEAWQAGGQMWSPAERALPGETGSESTANCLGAPTSPRRLPGLPDWFLSWASSHSLPGSWTDLSHRSLPWDQVQAPR